MRESLQHWIESYHGWAHILLLLGIGIVLHLVVFLFYRITRHKFSSPRFVWLRIFLNALRKPIVFLIWFVLLAFLIFFVTELLSEVSGRVWSEKILSIGASVLVLWFCLRFIKQVEIKMLTGQIGGKRFDRTTLDGLAKLARILVVSLSVLMILQEGFNVSMAAIYAAAGGIGVGITFAAQDLLKNFFGGLVLYFDRPFSIGDWISSPDRQIEGTVEKIGWRTTRILTLARRPLYVPNAVFLTVSVENPQRMLNRRIKQNIGVRFEDYKLLPTILAEIKTLLHEHPELDQTATQYINVMELTESSISLQLYAFTKTTNQLIFQDIQQALLLSILGLIEKHGAQTSFPTTTLQVPGIVLQQTKGIEHGST